MLRFLMVSYSIVYCVPQRRNEFRVTNYELLITNLMQVLQTGLRLQSHQSGPLLSEVKVSTFLLRLFRSGSKVCFLWYHLFRKTKYKLQITNTILFIIHNCFPEHICQKSFEICLHYFLVNGNVLLNSVEQKQTSDYPLAFSELSQINKITFHH